MSEAAEKPEPKAKAMKKYKVTIHTAEGDSDKGDVVLVHNYRQVQIQRDQEVILDETYLDVLKHTVVNTHTKNDKGEVVPVRIPRYSYSAEAV